MFAELYSLFSINLSTGSFSSEFLHNCSLRRQLLKIWQKITSSNKLEMLELFKQHYTILLFVLDNLFLFSSIRPCYDWVINPIQFNNAYLRFMVFTKNIGFYPIRSSNPFIFALSAYTCSTDFVLLFILLLYTRFPLHKRRLAFPSFLL